MADTLQTAMGISPHPHDRRHHEVRWETYLRKVIGGTFGKERKEVQQELVQVTRKNNNKENSDD